MPGKKKSPTPSTAKKTGVEPTTETPKGGSVSSLLPPAEVKGAKGAKGAGNSVLADLAPFEATEGASLRSSRSRPAFHRRKGAKGAKGAKNSTLGTWHPSIRGKAAKAAKTAGNSALAKLAAFDSEGRSVALVSPEYLRAFLAARGGVLAPGGPSLGGTAAGLLLAPSSALYVADGEERPLAEELLEIPALTRLGGASRVASEAA